MTLLLKRNHLMPFQLHISTLTKWICYLSVYSMLAVISVMFGNIGIGQIIIGLFAIGSMLYGVKSEDSFQLAATALGVVIVSSVFQIDVLVKGFSVYAFLLVGVGLLCAIKEQWQSTEGLVMRSYISGAYSRNYKKIPKTKRVFINRRMG